MEHGRTTYKCDYLSVAVTGLSPEENKLVTTSRTGLFAFLIESDNNGIGEY